MTTKDYIKFAKLYKELTKHEGMCEEGIAEDVLRDLLNGMIKIFEEDNPKFNKRKFMEAINE